MGLSIEEKAPTALRPYLRNARRHTRAKIKQIAASIERFGFTNPVLISDDGEIIAGHGRVEAAKLLGLASVPTLKLSHLSETERRAYVIADNKLAINAGWDAEMLAIELQGLIDLDFDVTLTGFSLAEVDLTLDAARDSDPAAPTGPEDEIPSMAQTAVSRAGDLWLLGRHRLVCGDARRAEDYQAVLDGLAADLIFTDPPYNVPIDGHVCGSGRIRHREFAMGVGEMSEAAFTAFLTETLGAAAKVCRDGAIVFVCMDWRHVGELLVAGRTVFSELKNLCVWNKTNGGMGAFYRSKHELVCVFKVGDAPHTNSFGLGGTGRYRTNVWDYPGISSLGAAAKAPSASRGIVAADLARAGEILLQRLQTDVSTDTLPYLLDFLWSWRRLGDENAPRLYVERHIATQADFLTVMKGLRSWMYSDKVYRPINRPDTEPFLDGDAARRRLEMISAEGGEAAELARELLQDMRIGDSNYREGQETFFTDGDEKRYSPDVSAIGGDQVATLPAPRMRLSVGEDADHARITHGDMYCSIRRFFLRIRNADPAIPLSGVRVSLTNVDPPQDGALPQRFGSPLTIPGGDEELVPLIDFRESFDRSKDAGASSPTRFMTDTGHAAAGDGAVVTIRATALNAAATDIRVRTWVEDGRLRIQEVSVM